MGIPPLDHHRVPGNTCQDQCVSPLELRNAYLSAGVVTPKSTDDAAHVALATISGCRMIVSWNFKHIVHFEKIPKYNAVNTLNGYRSIEIFSPSQVIDYGDS
jgi:hypothetical protein